MQRKPLPTDISDRQWSRIKPLIPTSSRGRKRRIPPREIVNAINYRLHHECSWRRLPECLPAWETVYMHFRILRTGGHWPEILKILKKKP